MLLAGKRILVGITGGIAAYKTASLVRLLVKNGAQVQVVMTAHAKEFITPLTLATLSKNPILVDFFNPENGQWNSHVSIAQWADLFVIAPATANTIAKMTTGVADNLLLTTCLSARCPIMIAPSMDLDMYAHITTQRNLAELTSRGILIAEATEGELASGLAGKGRMAEPEQIFEQVVRFFNTEQSLLGKRALITVGGSVEQIDPVRCISNGSTGKMGYAIAAELRERGAEVTLIRACVDPRMIGSIPGAVEIEALSAQEMYLAVERHKDTADIIIMAAAVADFTVEHTATEKIKKEAGADTLTLTLKKTNDIAAMVGKSLRKEQCFVGFALETNNAQDNALDKLRRKNFDFIVLNSMGDKGAGIGFDTNKVTIYTQKGETYPFELKSKGEVAQDIVSLIEQTLSK